MAQPPPVQGPLQVRAQDVLANVQAAPAVPVPQQGPQAVPAPDNEAVVNADNANQNPAAPEPALEVKPCFFPFRLLSLSGLAFSLLIYEICPTRARVEFLMSDTTRVRVMPVESD